MNLNKTYIVAVVAAGALTLGSCNIYQKYETPADTAITRAYVEARSAAPDSTAIGNLTWEQVFTDPTLCEYINRALENNTSLRNAMLNVDIAHAQLKGAKLAYLPSLAIAPNGAGASYAGSTMSWTYTIPAQVSWEIDIFGKLLNSKRSAQAAVYQSEAYAQAARSQIISAVANTYYGIAAVRKQLELMRSTSQIWAENVNTMRDLKEAGRTNEAAVVQSSANYYSIMGNIKDMETSLDQLNNTMALLLNETPRVYDIASVALDKFQAPAFAGEGVSMTELAARPDVTASEQALAMAFYATNSARAAFYPGLTITANGGFTNLLGSFVKNPGDWFIQLAGSLVAPIFSRGRNIANLEASKARQKQALNNFEYTLLSAAAEVSDALTVYENNVAKYGFLEKQVAEMERSVSITNDLLQYADGTYLEVLTAQQGLLNAQSGAISCRLNQVQAVINLYQALGGGR
ncbi:MAG: TolC family protein [Muribaculaceae bacterium]|nr:TolC family protein [Muribaculaceae bacterium]